MQHNEENGSPERRDAETSFVNQFESVVARYASELAMKDGGQSWDYQHFNQLVNQIANGILNIRGSQSEPVALFLGQGAISIAVMFAILKAGKYYISLDPAFPPARNRFILENARAVLLISDTSNLGEACDLAQDELPVVQVEQIAENSPTNNPGLVISPDSPAYILYTSGSTGNPKGVLQNYRGLVHNAMRQREVLKLAPGHRATMLYSPSVMGAARDIYNVLLSGAALFPFDVRKNGLNDLAAWLVSEDINVFHTISSIYRHLLELFPNKNQYARIQKLLLGGEAVLKTDFEAFCQYFPDDAVLITGLGSTEAGTICMNVLNKTSSVVTSTVPVGFPVSGVNALVLDENDQPAERGTIGEICALSAYLAQGYWNNPQLTEKTFTAGDETQKLFHTGDLGQILPDGALLHCGRKDFQVKIRGFRIETTEIEVAIRASGMATDVVVTVFSGSGSRKRLIAYIVPRPNQVFSTNALKEFLASRLPGHMIPAYFEILEALPLTPNGKVDRNALPPPATLIRASPSAPRNQTEQVLLEIWQEILGIEEIAIDDNFFDTGGDSLLASSMLVNIEKTFGKRLSLSILIENDTIEKLANYILAEDPITRKVIIAIQPNGSRLPLFAFPGVHGDVLYLRNLAAYLNRDQAFYGVQLLHSDAMHLHSMEEMAAVYLSEIKKIQPGGPYLLAGHSFGGYLALEIARQLKAQGEQVAMLALWDTLPPGPRQQAPLFVRVRIHLDNMRGLSLRKKIVYPFQRLEALVLKLSRYPLAKKIIKSTKWYKPRKTIPSSQIAKHSYSPPPYDGDMILFKARERAWYVNWDVMQNWPRYVTGNIRVFVTPGDHGVLLHEPYVKDLAHHLNECLEQVHSELVK